MAEHLAPDFARGLDLAFGRSLLLHFQEMLQIFTAHALSEGLMLVAAGPEVARNLGYRIGVLWSIRRQSHGLPPACTRGEDETPCSAVGAHVRVSKRGVRVLDGELESVCHKDSAVAAGEGGGTSFGVVWNTRHPVALSDLQRRIGGRMRSGAGCAVLLLFSCEGEQTI